MIYEAFEGIDGFVAVGGGKLGIFGEGEGGRGLSLIHQALVMICHQEMKKDEMEMNVRRISYGEIHPPHPDCNKWQNGKPDDANCNGSYSKEEHEQGLLGQSADEKHRRKPRGHIRRIN
jgi:hypothetical protein